MKTDFRAVKHVLDHSTPLVDASRISGKYDAFEYNAIDINAPD